ncbi:hypothetical protein BJX99DRAFT_83344 [Aspergillus californicus]
MHPPQPQFQPNHLIIICCHAIYLGGPTNGLDEREWLIEPFQRGETPTFTNHVKAGIRMLDGDPAGLLVFSGGATKRSRTELTEAESYLNLAKDNNYFSLRPDSECSNTFGIDSSRITAETLATDSYQNVLFSILHFRLHTGTYPSRVTVVTHEFKRERFVECHFPAIGLDPGRVGVVGINPPEEVTPRRELVKGEEERGIGPWRRDRYGVGAELAGKRMKRGWVAGMERTYFLDFGLEVVEELVCWDGGGGNEVFPRLRELPWYRK